MGGGMQGGDLGLPTLLSFMGGEPHCVLDARQAPTLHSTYLYSGVISLDRPCVTSQLKLLPAQLHGWLFLSLLSSSWPHSHTLE